MFTPTIVQQVPVVRAFLRARFLASYPGADVRGLLEGFDEVDAMFTGRHPDYQALDTPYHDYVHTLQVTVCLVRLLEGWQASQPGPQLSARQFELTVTAALWHDAGYLKPRGDNRGTGAKYTGGHVTRGARLAAAHLRARGATPADVEQVVEAIRCTDVAAKPARGHDRNAMARIAGCALGTADLLAQMAAPDYPDRLETLFRELKESDDLLELPPEERRFRTAGELVIATPGFWRRVVRPRLENELHGVYRYLARPAPLGPNGYVDAVERNIATIRLRATVRTFVVDRSIYSAA
jgi:hypothetical protein